jgi:hypothetical protein
MAEPNGEAAVLERRIHWHSDAHRAWGKERLFFYRLSFAPVYDPRAIQRSLLKLLTARRVGSFVVYELYGSWDLLVRLWLPSDVQTDEFSEALEDALEPVDLTHLTGFAVTGIVRHWVWGPGDYPRPDDDTLTTCRPPDFEVKQVNQGDPGPDLLERLGAKHLATEAVHTLGIKFAMVVTPPTTEPNVRQRRQIVGQLTRIVDRASDKHIADLSLYAGHGENFGVALIMGRVDLRHFDALRTALAHPISRGLGPHALGARTVTMVVAGSELRREVLPLADEILDNADVTINEALESHEHHRAEVKGSAFVDYERLLRGDKILVESKSVTDAFIKAVLGMLNADGGTIVLGAIELGRLPEAESELEGSPVGNGRWCVGVDAEWDQHRWDGYERRLDQVLLSRITPNPALWIASIEPLMIEGRTVVGIFVRKPDRFWYYPAVGPDKSRFYVRRGGSTIDLSGPDGDLYKESNPRK